MIYLIITTSINNRYGLLNNSERKDRYLYAISQTLNYVPDNIIPIIVENNGKRETYLDNFYHNNKKVKVIYTDNNKFNFINKGINELLDIKYVINEIGINDNDIIIKLTGRYRVLSNVFFNEIINNQNNFDVFIKFFGTCSLKYEKYDCILGLYAIKSVYIKLINDNNFRNYNSPEIAFSKYIRLCGAKIKEIINLDLECKFADDNRILNV